MCADLSTKGATWNNTRAIIFHRVGRHETLRRSAALLRPLRKRSTQTGGSRFFSGPTSEDQRTEIKRAFNSDPQQHPVRILVATESAREGLNLQAHCWNLFHFDVSLEPQPGWNSEMAHRSQASTEGRSFLSLLLLRATSRRSRSEEADREDEDDSQLSWAVSRKSSMLG